MQKRERFLSGTLEEAEMQPKALRRGRNLAFSEDTYLEKGKSAVESDPQKSWSEIETEAGVEQEQMGLEVSLLGIH